MPKDYRPSWLRNQISSDRFSNWLNSIVFQEFRHDQASGNSEFPFSHYFRAILTAIQRTEGLDELSCLPIDWGLIGMFDPTEAELVGRNYLHRFSAMPVVVRVSNGVDSRNFLVTRHEFRESDLSNPDEYVAKMFEIAKTKAIGDLLA